MYFTVAQIFFPVAAVFESLGQSFASPHSEISKDMLIT